METNPIENEESNVEDVNSNDELKEFQDELLELQSELKDIENQIRQNKGGDNGLFKELMAIKSDLMKQIEEVEMDIEFIKTSNQ
jgi:hypothetical protein